MRQILTDLGVDQSTTATVLRVDNRSAIDLAKEQRFHSRTKHIRIQYHAIREHVAANTFELVHTSTHDMIADGLTKPLERQAHQTMVVRLGLE